MIPYHDWSDASFDWKALGEAAQYLEKNCIRWGRLGIWTKEKFGTLRISTTCAFVSEFDMLHSICYPGHAYIRWPRWFRVYIDWPLGRLCHKLRIIHLINKYQVWVLKHFWNKAAKKWPHIKEEILYEMRFWK